MARSPPTVITAMAILAGRRWRFSPGETRVVNSCEQCLTQQREIDRLAEQVTSLMAALRYSLDSFPLLFPDVQPTQVTQKSLDSLLAEFDPFDAALAISLRLRSPGARHGLEEPPLTREKAPRQNRRSRRVLRPRGRPEKPGVEHRHGESRSAPRPSALSLARALR